MVIDAHVSFQVFQQADNDIDIIKGAREDIYAPNGKELLCVYFRRKQHQRICLVVKFLPTQSL